MVDSFQAISLPLFQFENCFNFQQPFTDCTTTQVLSRGHITSMSMIANDGHETNSVNCDAAISDTQATRLSMIRGKLVLLIGLSGENAVDVVLRLHSLGVIVYVLDDERLVNTKLSFISTTATFIHCPFSEAIDPVQAALQTLQRNDVSFDAVTSYAEAYIFVAGSVAAALSLERNPVSAYLTARDKRLSRTAMEKAMLPVPVHATICTNGDIDVAVQKMRFPAVLKPQNGLDSLGVIRCENADDVRKAYSSIVSEGYATPFVKMTTTLLEEMYVGDEFDVDIVLRARTLLFAKVSDNFAPQPPWFQETGASAPSLYPSLKQDELASLAVQAVLALGFTHGTFHVECRYTKDGPRVIEVNGRMGGGPVHDIIRKIWGVDLVAEHCMSFLNIPGKPFIAKQPLRGIALYHFVAPISGTMLSHTWLDYLNSEHVTVKYHKKEGEFVKGAREGIPQWMASIFVEDDTVENALKRVAAAASNMNVSLRKENETEESLVFFPGSEAPFCDLYKNISGSN